MSAQSGEKKVAKKTSRAKCAAVTTFIVASALLFGILQNASPTIPRPNLPTTQPPAHSSLDNVSIVDFSVAPRKEESDSAGPALTIIGVNEYREGVTDGIVFPVKTPHGSADSLVFGQLDEFGDYVDYIDATPDSRLDDVGGREELNLVWSGTDCGGAWLRQPELTKQCDSAEVAAIRNGEMVEINNSAPDETTYLFRRLSRRWCHAINKSKVDHHKVPCGEWRGGHFRLERRKNAPGDFSQRSLSLDFLADTLEATRASRGLEAFSAAATVQPAPQTADPPQCRTPSFFSSALNPSRITVHRQSKPNRAVPLVFPYEMQSKECPNTFRYMNNVEALGVLYQHAYAVTDTWRDSSSSADLNSSETNAPTANDAPKRPRRDAPKGIIFTGDSITRNIFNAIVAHIRNERVTSEHYYHRDALYVLHPSTDSVTMLNSEGKKEKCGILKSFFPGYELSRNVFKKCSWKTNLNSRKEWPLFAILFVWDVTPGSYRVDTVRMSNIALQIGGYAYWWYATKNMSLKGGSIGIKGADIDVPVDPYLDAVSRTMEQTDTARRFVWMTTPLVSFEHTLLPMFGPLGERNLKMARWVKNATPFATPLSYMSPLDLRNVTEDPFDPDIEARNSQEVYTFINKEKRRYLFDLAGMADISRMAGVRPRDGLHYPCSWAPRKPAAITRLRSNKHHCRDPLNANAVQWLLHLLLFMD